MHLSGSFALNRSCWSSKTDFVVLDLFLLEDFALDRSFWSSKTDFAVLRKSVFSYGGVRPQSELLVFRNWLCCLKKGCIFSGGLRPQSELWSWWTGLDMTKFRLSVKIVTLRIPKWLLTWFPYDSAWFRVEKSKNTLKPSKTSILIWNMGLDSKI